MEEYFIILRGLVENISIPSAIVVVFYFIAKTVTPLLPSVSNWIQSKTGVAGEQSEGGDMITLSSIDKRVKLLGSNHMHELKDSLNRIEGSLDKLVDAQNRANESLAYIKAKIDTL